MDMIRIGDIVTIGHTLDDSEALLQALRKAVCCRLDRRSVKRVIDILGSFPLGGVLVELLHNLKAKLFAFALGKLLAVKSKYALPKTSVTKRDCGVTTIEEVVDLLALLETRKRAILPKNWRRVRCSSFKSFVAAAKRLMAKLAPLVKDLPESFKISMS